MLYTFVKYVVRSGLLVFCRKIIFTNRNVLHQKGPLLLACNHPNSFFDALLLGAYFKHPVHFLARGDAFKNPLAKKILTALKAIPIYRLSEGKEYLSLNDYTFERCTEILMNGGIVLIFSEGLCLNQWQLRPLKKGTARLALSAWKQQSAENSFPILPVSFNYSSFTDFRKAVIIAFGKPVFAGNLPKEKNEAEQILILNKLLSARLERGILSETDQAGIIRFLLLNLIKIKKNEQDMMEVLKKKQILLSNLSGETFYNKIKKIKKIPLDATDLFLNLILIVLLFIPALAGYLFHLPVYLPLKYFIKKKTKGTVFYHSALFSGLIITYPIYVLLLSVMLIIAVKNLIGAAAIIIIPSLALTYLMWRDCFESMMNYVKLPKKEISKLQQVLQR